MVAPESDNSYLSAKTYSHPVNNKSTGFCRRQRIKNGLRLLPTPPRKRTTTTGQPFQYAQSLSRHSHQDGCDGKDYHCYRESPILFIRWEEFFIGHAAEVRLGEQAHRCASGTAAQARRATTRRIGQTEKCGNVKLEMESVGVGDNPRRCMGAAESG